MLTSKSCKKVSKYSVLHCLISQSFSFTILEFTLADTEAVADAYGSQIMKL